MTVNSGSLSSVNNVNSQIEFYKTAHLLLAKHGDRVVDDIKSKIDSYGQAADKEAVFILEGIKNAAEKLMMFSTNNKLPN